MTRRKLNDPSREHEHKALHLLQDFETAVIQRKRRPAQYRDAGLALCRHLGLLPPLRFIYHEDQP